MEIYMRCIDRQFVSALLVMIFSLSGNVFAQTRSDTKTFQTSDAKIYYEIYGKGQPVVLFHGGLFGSIQEFQKLIEELSQRFKVVAIETRGHGRSELGKKTLSYELLADDFASVIKEISDGPVTVIGFSDGGIAAYHLVTKYPQLVRKLIVMGAPLGIYGYTKQGVESLKEYDSPEALSKIAPRFVKERKMQMSDTTQWNTFIYGLAAMWKQKEYISPERVRLINCPTLLIAGDNDEYTRTAHLIEIRDCIRSSQLAIIPGSGHTVLHSQSEITIKIIVSFLDR